MSTAFHVQTGVCGARNALHNSAAQVSQEWPREAQELLGEQEVRHLRRPHREEDPARGCG